MRRRHKRNTSTKLGLLFIVLILSLASISASYAHWEDILFINADMETTEWEEKTIDPLLMVAYEDLQIIVGTGTPGYWKNHPEAWPVNEITIGGMTYTKSQAIDIMETSNPGQKDKTYDMFRHLVTAKLNVIIGCESSCIDQTIIDTDAWMTIHPVGSDVYASDSEWQAIEPKYNLLVAYNEGDLCALSREKVQDLNDYDYNDFVVNISVKGTYVQENLCDLNFTFEAMARGAAYKHTFKMIIPALTFGTDGTYTITYYDTDGTTILNIITAPFYDISDIYLTIFQNTREALPPTAGHSWCANAIDCTGIYPGRITNVCINFSGFFCVNDLDLEDYTLDTIGTHGTNLFFDPYLYVWDTGENIHKGDPRFIPTPNDWIWPEEFAAIRTVYPYDGSKGVQSGNPPIFIGHWYEVPPTMYKWDPHCP